MTSGPHNRSKGPSEPPGRTRRMREEGYPDLYGDEPEGPHPNYRDYPAREDDAYGVGGIAAVPALPPSRGPARGIPPRPSAAQPPAEPHRRATTNPPPEPQYDAQPAYSAPPAAHYAPRPEPRPPQFQAEPPLEGPDLSAPSRDGATEPVAGHASIVPATSVTGRSLTLVISIMCFLACLTAGAVYMMNQSASAWLKDIASEVTVQIEPREKVDIDKLVGEVSAFLKRQPGLAAVTPLSIDRSAELLEPWLGHGDALKTLPVPRLIAIEINRSQPPDLEQLRAAISGQFKGVSLDDHRQWQKQIRTVTRSFALGGLAILLLVGAATTAIIVSATKSSMASNREIVEVLHLVGATDGFIAREFERHFLRLGVKAGIVGAGCAMLVFIAIPLAMELLGGGSLSSIELKRLVGTGSLDLAGYLLLGIVVVVIAALCMLTSRWGVYRILHSQH